MVASTDGKITIGGRSGPLGNEADKQLFHHLRTQVDAVMVGAGTLRTERYGRLIRDPELRAKREREGLAAEPLACIVSARLALSGDLPLFQVPEQRVVVLTQAPDAEIEGAAAQITYIRGGELADQLRRLRDELGVRSVLCEGGPTLNAALLQEDLVDELFLSLAPLLVGGAEPLTAVGGTALPDPAELELVSAYEGESHLFLRYRVRR